MENASGDVFNEFLMDIRSYLPPEKYWWQYKATCTVYPLPLTKLNAADLFQKYKKGGQSKVRVEKHKVCRSFSRLCKQVCAEPSTGLDLKPPI